MTGPAVQVLRVLVAGAGAFGREHLGRLTTRRDVQVVGVADPDPAALAAVRDRHRIADCLENALDLMDRIAAHAIIVASPAATHAELSEAAIVRGLAVLLEKPVSMDATRAALLWEAAERSGAFVLPGHVLRFSRDHRRLVEIAQSGQIGDIRYVNSRRYRDDSHAIRYRDVGPVFMTLIHDIDLAQWITRSPFRSVYARRSGSDPIRSLIAANAETESGTICDLRTAWIFSAGSQPPDRVEVVGELGSVELLVGHALRLFAEGRVMEIPLTVDDDALANEHDHFIACLRDRRHKPALTLREAVDGLRLADAMEESLRLDRIVSLDP
jgi:predicted dehydrogenase